MEKIIDYLTFEDYEKLHKACTEDIELRIAMKFGFGSGLRISEIIGLYKFFSRCCDAEVIDTKKEDNEKKRKIKVCSNCNKELSLKEVKRKKRAWKIPPLTKDKINFKEHKIRLEIAKGNKWRITVTPPNLNESDLNKLPLKVSRRTLQYRFAALTLKVLGKKMKFHVLRHGFGNYQANVLKVPLPIVQQLMGHARLDTTGIYTRANPEYAIQTAWKAMGGE